MTYFLLTHLLTMYVFLLVSREFRSAKTSSAYYKKEFTVTAQNNRGKPPLIPSSAEKGTTENVKEKGEF